MTPQQIDLIRSSFAKIHRSRDESAGLFYQRLFTLAPDARRLFTTDIEAQGRKLMDTLAIAVATLRDPATLTRLLEGLAKRHVGYGATAAHYEYVGAALLWMLEQRLGSEFTPAVKAAWVELYGEVSGAMQRLAREAAEPVH